MKNKARQVFSATIFILLSVVSLFMGIVPFRPISPSTADVSVRIIVFLVWLSVGAYACSRMHRCRPLLLIPPFCVMLLHAAGANYLISMPLSTLIAGDTYLYASMEFVFALFVQVGLIIVTIIKKQQTGQKKIL